MSCAISAGVPDLSDRASKPVPLTDKEVEALGRGNANRSRLDYAVGDTVKVSRRIRWKALSEQWTGLMLENESGEGYRVHVWARNPGRT